MLAVLPRGSECYVLQAIYRLAFPTPY